MILPRKRRLHVTGGVYHVTIRGNNRAEIFRDDADRYQLNEYVANAIEDERGRVHCFCWMTNHIHVAIQVSGRPLGRIVHSFATKYARYFNNRYDRTGHLFESRYYANLVDVDSYLLELVRYIHRNPLKAGLVEQPASYRWSSHRYLAGGELLEWLSAELVLSLFHSDVSTARKELDRFVKDSSMDEQSESLFGAAEDLAAKTGRENTEFDLESSNFTVPQFTLEEIVEIVCARHCINPGSIAGPSRERVVSRVRAEIAREALQSGAANLAALGRRMNRTGNAIGALLRRYVDSAAR